MSLTQGELFRDLGIARVEENTDERWRQSADDAIEELIRRRLPFTVNDCRDLGVPEPAHPNSWGARFSAWQRSGRIVHEGYERSPRAERHASIVSIWRPA